LNNMLPVEKIVLVVFLLIISIISILEILFISGFILNHLRKTHRKSMFVSKPAIIVHIIAAFGILCFLYSWFIEPYNIEVKQIPIRTDKLKQTSFRIVQISDLHCNAKPRIETKIVGMINQLKPDVVVFTGDALNTPRAITLFKETMKNIEASMAKVAVYGNWDTRHWTGLDYYSGTGFELLDAKTIALTKNGEAITISGLSCDNPNAAGTTLGKLSGDSFNIFCYHFSDLIEYIQSSNVDLYLSGHTHGGQVALPFYGALVTLSNKGKKYESGMYYVGKTMLYVNRGLGLEALPAPQVRFFARPEITVFDIEPAK
jgi:uncharacterized protein